MTYYTSIVNDQKGAGFKPAPFFIVRGLLLGCLLTVAQVMAEVPVVEIDARDTVTPVKASAYPSASATTGSINAASAGGSRQGQLSEIFVQMQQLQHEVQELRGLVEQQSFEIQTLKQQNKDNYIDLDKRISTIQSTVSSPGHSPATESSSNASVDVLPASGAEKDSYDAAYKHLDLGRKDDAIVAFQKHVALYPNGKYAPNAHCWMGQIYLSQSQQELAREQFAMLLKNFPEDRKAPDAKFALGKLYFQQGKKAEAKKLIQDVSLGDSKTAALAKTFLQDNF